MNIPVYQPTSSSYTVQRFPCRINNKNPNPQLEPETSRQTIYKIARAQPNMLILNPNANHARSVGRVCDDDDLLLSYKLKYSEKKKINKEKRIDCIQLACDVAQRKLIIVTFAKYTRRVSALRVRHASSRSLFAVAKIARSRYTHRKLLYHANAGATAPFSLSLLLYTLSLSLVSVPVLSWAC